MRIAPRQYCRADHAVPSLLCKGAVEVELGTSKSLTVGATDNDLTSAVTIACGSDTKDLDVGPDQMIGCTAQDASGNVATCVVPVTVVGALRIYDSPQFDGESLLLSLGAYSALELSRHLLAPSAWGHDKASNLKTAHTCGRDCRHHNACKRRCAQWCCRARCIAQRRFSPYLGWCLPTQSDRSLQTPRHRSSNALLPSPWSWELARPLPPLLQMSAATRTCRAISTRQISPSETIRRSCAQHQTRPGTRRRVRRPSRSPVRAAICRVLLQACCKHSELFCAAHCVDAARD